MVLIVYDIILIFSDSSRVLISHKTLHALLNNCMVCVAILIVCVPEGMPLAVSIATAFSTDRMQEESLLIKDMTALESSGQLTDVVVSKTSTLTTGDLKVNHIYICEGIQHINELQINEDLMAKLKTCVILNNSAHIEIEDETFQFVPEGNAVDVGLLHFI